MLPKIVRDPEKLPLAEFFQGKPHALGSATLRRDCFLSRPVCNVIVNPSYALERKIVEEFKKRNETIMCFELLGIKEGEDLPEPAVRDENYYESRPCEGLVKDAAEILEQEIFCRSDENKK